MPSESRSQRIFDEANLRIWIVASDRHGRAVGYSNRSSSSLLEKVPTGWQLSKEPCEIAEPESQPRTAWVLSGNGLSVVAVPHEFGAEFAIPVAVGVTSTAITSLVRHYWKRWKKANPSGSPEESTVRLQVSKRSGKKGRKVKTFELTGDLRNPEIRALVKKAMRGLKE